jgi:hypothetical protein
MMLLAVFNLSEVSRIHGISIQQKSLQLEGLQEPVPAFGWLFMTIFVNPQVMIQLHANPHVFVALQSKVPRRLLIQSR